MAFPTYRANSGGLLLVAFKLASKYSECAMASRLWASRSMSSAPDAARRSPVSPDFRAAVRFCVPALVEKTISALAKRQGATPSAVGRRALVRGLFTLRDNPNVAGA
jgi:hypothetical protein